MISRIRNAIKQHLSTADMQTLVMVNKALLEKSPLSNLPKVLSQNASKFLENLAAGPEKTVYSSMLSLTGKANPEKAFIILQEGSNKDIRLLISDVLDQNFAPEQLGKLSAEVQAEFRDVLIPFVKSTMNSIVNPLTGLGVKNIAFANDLLGMINAQSKRLN